MALKRPWRSGATSIPLAITENLTVKTKLLDKAGTHLRVFDMDDLLG